MVFYLGWAQGFPCKKSRVLYFRFVYLLFSQEQYAQSRKLTVCKNQTMTQFTPSCVLYSKNSTKIHREKFLPVWQEQATFAQVGRWAEFPTSCLSLTSSCSLHVEDSSSFLVTFYDRVVVLDRILASLAFVRVTTVHHSSSSFKPRLVSTSDTSTIRGIMMGSKLPN